MPKKRSWAEAHAARKRKRKETMLNYRNEYGNRDPTPYEADKLYNLNKRRATQCT